MSSFSRPALLLLLWFVASAALVVAGVPERMAPAALSLTLAWLAFAAAGACVFHRGVRRWVAGLDPRRLILLHQVRWVGVLFLVLLAQQRLPAAFAWTAGIGDSLLALAAGALLFAPREGRVVARGLRWWNAAGLVDLVVVVVLAIRLSLDHPGELAVFHELPLSALPLFVAPVLVASHVALLDHSRRLNAALDARDVATESPPPAAGDDTDFSANAR